MRKNYFIRDAVTNAKVFGFTDEEIKNAVKEGLENYERLKGNILKKTEEKKKS